MTTMISFCVENEDCFLYRALENDFLSFGYVFMMLEFTIDDFSGKIPLNLVETEKVLKISYAPDWS